MADDVRAGGLSVLHVHRAERADRLADALGEVLAVPPADPFAVEVVAVPAKGVERWLTQRLSHVLGADGGGSSGVCANVRFPSPAAVVADALAAVSDVDGADDPWHQDRVVWPLLEVIDGCAGQDWCSALGSHLGVGDAEGGHRRGRRLTLARHLARLFASYAAARPQMVRAWAADVDTDGVGSPLPADLAWQAELWRRLRMRVAVPSPAERLDEACAVLRERPAAVDLPSRLSLFGPTRLGADQLAVLAALGAHRDVHLWLAHPSPALWHRIGQQPVGAGAVRRRDDPTAAVPRHLLLASLGRDVRELQLTLAQSGHVASDTHHAAGQPPDTLLGRLQAQLRDDAPPTCPPPLRDPADHTVQLHACHGRARQVEVLREVLLGLLADDPTLEPRHVLVMCPDIETFAPLISATFGLAEPAGPAQRTGHHPGHQLRVRLADRALRQTNPLLATVAHVLDLADARVTASQVLDLAATPPVRRRFRFDDDDLDRLQDWVSESGVRWGLDREHRARFGLRHAGQNTWEAGLDRILLGAAMAEDDQRWLGLALPLEDVDSSDIDLAGRLAELVDRLTEVLTALSGQHRLEQWLDTLAFALDLLTEVGEADEWQLTQARRELGDVAAAAAGPAGAPVLSLADIRALLADRLKGRPTRASFRTGNLTMCSLVPMRSVPHRVVCLLGMDDGVFPRGGGSDGDDILLRGPCVGERDLRSEDRQLLLDAVVAAQEHLVVLYTGAHERTNAEQPPAVPVGELLDVLDRTARTASGARVRDEIVVRHPLQPFDARNFVAGRLGRLGPFSHDQAALAGARAAAGSRAPARAFLPGPLPPPDRDEPVELEALVGFVEHPVKAFLRQRLGLVPRADDDEIADALPVELAALDTWQVGERMLRARLAGAQLDACQQAEWRRGVLPPGPIGTRALEELGKEVEPLVEAAAAAAAAGGEPGAVDVAARLPGGRLVAGTVGDVRGTTVLRVTYSRLAAKHRLRAWALLLALQVGGPGGQWSAVTIGRGRRGSSRVSRATLTGVSPADALRHLGELVDLYDCGLREPLPIPPAASCAYATARHGGSSRDEARADAARAWRDGHEHEDRHHVLVWGDQPQFDDRLWQLEQADRLDALACRLWFPLLDAELLEAL